MKSRGNRYQLFPSSKFLLGAILALHVLCCSNLVQLVQARAILGVDLGSVYMKVALVQRGSPLEIVTNLHSKRKTEQMILFEGSGDNKQRFYGADANALLARKSNKTPLGMSVLLGQSHDHPTVQVSSLPYLVNVNMNQNLEECYGYAVHF